MNHLTPTPRVNKNGQTVTRHMKPDAVTAPPRTNLPTVRILMERKSVRDSLRQHLLAAQPQWGKDEGNLKTLLDIMQATHPDAIARFHQYLTTGHEEAREQSELCFDIQVTNIFKQSRKLSGQLTGRHHQLSFYEPDTTPDPEIYAEAQKRWNGLNVLAESGRENDIDHDEFIQWLGATTQITTATEAQLKSDTYWRGIAALTIYELITGHQIFWDEPKDVADSVGYIKSAGEHENVKGFIAISIERRMIDAPTILGILEQQKTTTASLHDGLL